MGLSHGSFLPFTPIGLEMVSHHILVHGWKLLKNIWYVLLFSKDDLFTSASKLARRRGLNANNKQSSGQTAAAGQARGFRSKKTNSYSNVGVKRGQPWSKCSRKFKKWTVRTEVYLSRALHPQPQPRPTEATGGSTTQTKPARLS